MVATNVDYLAEAVVTLSQAVYRVGEEAMSVDVQVELVSLPDGGLECPIVVTLTTTDGRKASMVMNYRYLKPTCYRSAKFKDFIIILSACCNFYHNRL